MIDQGEFHRASANACNLRSPFVISRTFAESAKLEAEIKKNLASLGFVAEDLSK